METYGNIFVLLTKRQFFKLFWTILEKIWQTRVLAVHGPWTGGCMKALMFLGVFSQLYIYRLKCFCRKFLYRHTETNRISSDWSFECLKVARSRSLVIERFSTNWPLVVNATQERYLFFGSTWYFGYWCDISDNICNISQAQIWSKSSAKFACI